MRALQEPPSTDSEQEGYLRRPRSHSAAASGRDTLPRLGMLPRRGVVDEVGVEVELLDAGSHAELRR